MTPFGICPESGKAKLGYADAVKAAKRASAAYDLNLAAYRCRGCQCWHYGGGAHKYERRPISIFMEAEEMLLIKDVGSREFRRKIAREAKKKKPVKQRAVADPLAIWQAIADRWEIARGELLTAHIATQFSFRALRDGNGQRDDWDDIWVTLLACFFRACDIEGGEALAKILVEGIEAMRDCHARGAAIGRFVFTGPQIIAVAKAIDLCEQIDNASTRAQMKIAVCAANKVSENFLEKGVRQ